MDEVVTRFGAALARHRAWDAIFADNQSVRAGKTSVSLVFVSLFADCAGRPPSNPLWAAAKRVPQEALWLLVVALD